MGPSWVQILLMSPVFCFQEIDFIWPPRQTFPEFQRADSNSCSSGKGGNAKTNEEQSRNNSAAQGMVLVPPQGTYIKISLSSSAGTKAPKQVEDGNFRLITRSLEHRPVTSPPTNQKKATQPAALTPSFASKNFSPKPIREFGFFEHDPPILLAWPCNKPSSAPNVQVCLASLCLRHTNLCLVTEPRRVEENLFSLPYTTQG